MKLPRHNKIFPFQSVMLVTGLALTLGFVAVTGCTVTPQVEERPVVSKLSVAPTKDAKIATDDFYFPSEPPKLSLGKDIFQNNCATCHAPSYWQEKVTQTDLAYTTPIDMYLMLSSGKAPKVTGPSDERRQVLPASHPDFRDTLSRDERWAAIFYVRYLAGAGDYAYKNLEGKDLKIATIFGANCAVCHGTRGYGVGTLHTGHAPHGEMQGARIHGGLFFPPPGNFHQYDRLYNRTDMQLVKYIQEGIYPSAMPPWAGLYDKDQKFYFDDLMIWQLVKHVRQFAYNDDLSDETPAPPGPLVKRSVQSSSLKAAPSPGLQGSTGAHSSHVQ